MFQKVESLQSAQSTENLHTICMTWMLPQTASGTGWKCCRFPSISTFSALEVTKPMFTYLLTLRLQSFFTAICGAHYRPCNSVKNTGGTKTKARLTMMQV